MDDLIREMLEPEKPEPGVVARRRRFVATTAIIGLAVAGVTSLTTSALFVDTDSSQLTGFITGTVSIDSSPATSSMTTDPLAAPGDSAYKAIQVQNDGSLAQRYAVRLEGTGENGLAGVLDFRLYEVPSAAACKAPASGVDPTGTGVAPITAEQKLGTSLRTVVGDTTEGEQAGDRDLNAGASEWLCVRLTLPLDSTNAVADSSASLELTFDAEQTANNA